jgi:hypothetical protein
MVIGSAELLPDKTHHLYPKVPAMVVINYMSVNVNGLLREGDGQRHAKKTCLARVDHSTLTGKCRQGHEEGESKARRD